MLIDTDGAKVGQINGLSVLQLGDFAFGRPSRITARVRMGEGRVIDIEREVELGGPLHSKGVMILWGYLAGRYAQDVPLSLAATPGLRAVLRRRRRRQRLLGRALRAALGAGRGADRASRSRSPARSTSGARCRRSAASTRRSRASSTSARPRPDRAPGRADPAVQRPAPDAARGRRRGRRRPASSRSTPSSTIDQGIEILTGVKAGERDLRDASRSAPSTGWSRTSCAPSPSAARLSPHVPEEATTRRPPHDRAQRRRGARPGARRSATDAWAPRPVARAAAIRVARAFHSEIESLFVEDSTLLDIAGLPFAREISLTGRQSRPLSAEVIERQMRQAAAAMMREIEHARAPCRSLRSPHRRPVRAHRRTGSRLRRMWPIPCRRARRAADGRRC